MSENKWKISPGKWMRERVTPVAGETLAGKPVMQEPEWWVVAPDTNEHLCPDDTDTAIIVAQGGAKSERDMLAISRVPKMLEFIRDVKETCVYQRTLVERAEALLAGLHEDYPDA